MKNHGVKLNPLLAHKESQQGAGRVSPTESLLRLRQTSRFSPTESVSNLQACGASVKPVHAATSRVLEEEEPLSFVTVSIAGRVVPCEQLLTTSVPFASNFQDNWENKQNWGLEGETHLGFDGKSIF